MRSQQEIFDIVVDHLYKQGRPSMIDGTCSYISEDGCMCAVGVLIPDEVYDKDMEGKVVVCLLKYKNLPKEFYVSEYSSLLYDLQYCHDGCRCFDNGKFDLYDLTARLSLTAKKYDLQFKAKILPLIN